MTGRSRGRPKTPTALKVLEGNPGNRTIPKNEVKPAPLAPKCPSWLHKYAKKEWKLLAPKLEALGLLTEVDISAFASYCQAYARWREAEEFMTKHDNTIFKTPSGYLQQLPQVAIAQKYMALMLTSLSKFGLSPSDRAGLVASRPEGKSNMSRLLSR
ncbi:MAG: phage terminase small subunit P27 family [Dehalococcoidia bacterium]|nr:phage terminase small subunit P27 family [Dehalococcoidia bacterium]